MTRRCVLCEDDGGRTVWRDARCRVVVADEPFPGYCRVIWNAHVSEMTDLDTGDRDHLMRVVWATESVLRAQLAPDKMNLACLGNVVPHLHWHVIPRFADDSHFPQTVWGARQRDPAPRSPPPEFVDQLSRELRRALAAHA